MKFELVDDAKQAWRWMSTRFMAASAVVQTTWVGLPDDLKQHFPAIVVTALSVGLLLLGIGGRVIKQPKKQRAE